MEIGEQNNCFGENNTMATFHYLNDHNHMEMSNHRTLAISHYIGDILLMATNRTTGNISSSVQHSKDDVVSFYSCLLANKFPI